MQTILNVIVPIFAVIAMGFLAARLKLLDGAVGDGLVRFVFVVAVPVLLFETLATADFGGANPAFLWLAYFLGVALTWGIASLLVRRLTGADRRTGVIAGISASFANTVFVAIPTVERAYGDIGLEPLFLIISIHLPTMMVAATLLMERAADADAARTGALREPVSLTASLRRVAMNLTRNAIVVGILAGCFWRVTGLPMPAVAVEVTGLVGSTAGPVSLFAMGMSLTRYGIRGDLGASILVSLIGLVLMPAIVYFTAAPFLSPLWLKVAVLTAACPAGVNSFLLATHFNAAEKLAATTILVSTLLSVGTLAGWLAFLG